MRARANLRQRQEIGQGDVLVDGVGIGFSVNRRRFALYSPQAPPQAPVPAPSYSAKPTRVVIGTAAIRGAKNQITDVSVKRGGKTGEADTRTIDGTSGNLIFVFPPFAPTASITIDMIGKIRAQSCVLDRGSRPSSLNCLNRVRRAFMYLSVATAAQETT